MILLVWLEQFCRARLNSYEKTPTAEVKEKKIEYCTYSKFRPRNLQNDWNTKGFLRGEVS